MGKRKDLRVWRAKLWWLHDLIRASSKLQLLWDVPGLQWSKERRWSHHWKKGAWSDESSSLYIMWMAVCMYVAYLGNTWHQDALWEEGKPAETVWCFGLGILGSCHPCGCYFNTYYLPKNCCRPCIPFHGNHIPCWLFPALSSFSRIMHHATKQKWFEEHNNELECWLGIIIP